MESQAMTHGEKRARLFNVREQFEVSTSEFEEEWWPLVSNTWTRWGSNRLANGDEWTVFACRFLKHNESSTRKEDISSEKRRKTHPRDPNQCFAKMKVTRIAATLMVRIERYATTPDHSHTLEDSDRLKRSQAIKKLVEEEAVKPYASPSIAAAVKELATKIGIETSAKNLTRKDVTNIKQKVRAPENAILIGGPDLESDIRAAMNFLLDRSYLVERFTVLQKASFSQALGS